MGKKAISVWLCSTLTVFSLLHFAEAVSAFLFGTPVRLIQLYPVIGQKLQQTLAVQTYLWLSAASTMILWGITCAVVFENPVETFLNKILSDAKEQSTVESQMVEGKSELLDTMYDAMETNNEAVSYIKDMMQNVRTEVKGIRPLSENVDKMKTELATLKREIKRLEEGAQYPKVCLSCGKPLLPEFKMCPYCGEKTQTIHEKVISVQGYR